MPDRGRHDLDRRDRGRQRRALLRAGARAEIVVAATHGLLLLGAHKKLDHPGVREVFVTDTLRVAENDWPKLGHFDRAADCRWSDSWPRLDR